MENWHNPGGGHAGSEQHVQARGFGILEHLQTINFVPHFPQSLQFEQPSKGMKYPFRDLQVTSSVPHLGRAFTDVQELKQA